MLTEDKLFKLLSSDLRYRIVKTLAESDTEVRLKDLVASLHEYSQPVISISIKELYISGLITRIRSGQSVSYGINCKEDVKALLSTVTGCLEALKHP